MFFNERKNSISIKIGDLGNSKEIQDYLNSWVGTPFYQSPELVANQAYSEKTDVWYVYNKKFSHMHLNQITCLIKGQPALQFMKYFD